MTTVYKSSSATGVGDSSAVVGTIASTSAYGICSSINVANLTATLIYVTLSVTRAAASIYLAKNFRVEAGNNAEIVHGKIILLPSDTITATSSITASADILMSYLEEIA
jgi:hypothetical protein